MLQRVTERRLAEADHRVLHGVPLDQISQIWGDTGVLLYECTHIYVNTQHIDTLLNHIHMHP